MSRKHLERTTVMRREVQKALGKTRGKGKEIEGLGEELTSPSQMLETWKEARWWREDEETSRKASKVTRYHVAETEGKGMYTMSNILNMH